MISSSMDGKTRNCDLEQATSSLHRPSDKTELLSGEPSVSPHAAFVINPPPSPRPGGEARKGVTSLLSESPVLARLQVFLPAMRDANVKLEEAMQSRPAKEFDIEDVDEDGSGPHIQMELGLGAAELRDEAAVAAAERAMGEWDPNRNCCDSGGLEQEGNTNVLDVLDREKARGAKKSKIEVLA